MGFLHSKNKAFESTHATILAVGPLPPPLTGTPISFQIFCDEVRRSQEVNLDVIDASPRRLKQGRGTGIRFTPTNLGQALRILRQFARSVYHADQVIIFGSSGYVISLGPLLLALAKMAGKPCFFRVFGGSLDRYLTMLPKPLFLLALQTLRRFDGVIVQTELLCQYCSYLLGASKVHLVSGYRKLDGEVDTNTVCKSRIDKKSASENSAPSPAKEPPMRLAFLGIIKAEKGVFTLLKSLRQIAPIEEANIHCDLFGAIYEPTRLRFENELAQTPNVTYRGVLPWAQVVPTLQTYDALVLPTYYHGEGHPGVLIEAMMAGIPVITTNFRAIPEIIENRVNGLLVNPHDPDNLAAAIRLLYHDRVLWAEMAQQSQEMGQCFDARRIVPQILHAIGIRDAGVEAVGRNGG